MNQQTPKTIRVNCGQICISTECTATEINLLHTATDELQPNITIGYDQFVEDSDELPLEYWIYSKLGPMFFVVIGWQIVAKEIA